MTAAVADRFTAPMDLGCLCGVCPLGPTAAKPGYPVLPEIRAHAQLYLLGEAPGRQEERQEMPFVGPSGKLLADVLQAHGLYRSDVSLSNAVLCRPPSEMRVYLRVLSGRNRTREAKAKKEAEALVVGVVASERKRALRESLRELRVREDLRPWPTPIECCRPRVLREIARARAIVTLGATAFAAVTGRPVGESGMMSWRGFPQTWSVGT